MRALRIRPGVHCAPIDGGVYFSSARATFVVQGPAVLFRVVDTCLPLLEDGTDIDELVDAVGAASARGLLTRLVSTLESRGLIIRLDRLRTPEPGAAERQRFPETLAYLESYSDDPYRDFRRIRRARVLLAGPPEAVGTGARGLVRAGAGQVLVATTEPERLSGLASRHPEVRLLIYPDGGIPALVAGDARDAAVIVTDDAFPVEAILRLPAACVAVPVRLGKDLAIVGPAMEHAGNAAAVERLWARAMTWCRLDGDDELVRPSGDMLAGALAAQAAIDALAGLNHGRAHIVHGPDLASDSITPNLTLDIEVDEGNGADLGRVHALNPRHSEPGWIDDLSQPWSGLFRVSVPGHLPQLPVAITLADGRSSSGDGRALGCGPNQEVSTTEAALQALRLHCLTDALTDASAVAAAGLDEAQWLLDGALRLLADLPGDERPIEWLAIDDIDARRLWRALEEYEFTPVQLSCRHVAGFGWTLVTVFDRRTGAALAGGWGPTTAVGAVAALQAAIARQQLRRTVDPGFETADTRPGLLTHLHGPHLEDLEAAVRDWLGHEGLELRGERLQRDPVTGPLPVWCGPVWLDA